MGMWPNSTGMVLGWSPTKIVQMVLIGWISRSRGPKIGLQIVIFKNLVWLYKAQSFQIWYIASSRSSLPIFGYNNIMASPWPLTFSSGEPPRALWAFLFLLYPHHKMWGRGYTGFALLRWSVCSSVRPSPIRVCSITPLLMEGFPSNLNDTFTSTILTIIFQRSLDTDIVPKDWKHAIITPAFKKGSKSKPSNYRPISLTCIALKLMEHIIVSNMMDYFDTHNIRGLFNK